VILQKRLADFLRPGDLVRITAVNEDNTYDIYGVANGLRKESVSKEDLKPRVENKK